MDDPEICRRMYLRLHLADGVGAITIRRLIEHFGNIEAAVNASAGQLRRVEGIGEKTAAAIADVDESVVDEELALTAENGTAVLCVEDSSYPAALKKIYDPPPVLYVRGEITEVDAVALAVVGSRRCSHYGLEQADRFGGLLGRAGFTVVSGGARGIDTAAHRGALAAGGRTIAVMGCGLSEMYPRENKKLFEQIIADGRGAIISELPMRIGIKGQNFPKRNRIISGLSLGVLVVEAARRSGSLITARLALEQSKEIFALPGRVDSPFSAGTNSLIAANSAALVQNIEDILDGLDRVGEVLKDEGAAEPVARHVELTGTETALMEHLLAAELSLDELIRRSGLPSSEATAAMTMLAIKGVVAQKPGGLFTARSSGA